MFYSSEAKKPNNGSDIRKFIQVKGTTNSLGGPSSAPQVGGVASSNKTFGKPEMVDISSDRMNTSKAVNEFRKGQDNLFHGSGNVNADGKRKNSNIHGFTSSATGSVKRVDVSNASQSNVHGFGRGSGISPAKKRPNTGELGGMGSFGRGGGQTVGGGSGSGPGFVSGEGRGRGVSGKGFGTAFGRGRGGGRGSGSVGRGRGSTGFGGGNGGNGSGFGRGRGGGGGLAMRGRGSSGTITVKGRGVSKTETKAQEIVDAEVKMSASQNAFQGHGVTLGGSRTGVSRLLSLVTPASHSTSPTQPSSTNPAIHNPSASPEPSCIKESNRTANDWPHSLSPSPEPEDGDTNICPLCNTDIPAASLGKHLDDCMGMFDDRMSIDGDSGNEESGTLGAVKRSVSESSDDCMVVEAASGTRENVEDCTGGSVDRVDDNDVEAGGEDRYPCPVCGEKFTQSNINQHLDTHF